MTSENAIHDIHICGACRTEFNDIAKFLQHKKACYLSSSGNQAQQSRSSHGTKQVTQQHSLGSQLSGSEHQCESHLIPLPSVATHIHNLETSQSFMQLSTSLVQADNHHPSLETSGSQEDSQLSYSLHGTQTTQHRSSDVAASSTYSWSSGNEIQIKSVSTDTLCDELTVVTDHLGQAEKLMNEGFSVSDPRNHKDMSTENVAVYVVSPKSFASSVLSQEKFNSGLISMLPNLNTGSLWANVHSSSQQAQLANPGLHKTTASCKNIGNISDPDLKSEASAQLNEILIHPESSLSKIQLHGTGSYFYMDSDRTPNSDSSTPCPEDLEVGQISAAMLGQKNQHEELRALLGVTQNVSAVSESSVTSHNASVLNTASTTADTASKVLEYDMNTVPQYIRENTASAPIIKVKSSTNGPVKRRISMEKRERLQGVSDDLVSSSPFSDALSGCGAKLSQSRKNTLQIQIPSGNSLTTHSNLGSVASSSVTTPVLTGYKAIFTSPSSAGHRLTPTQPGGNEPVTLTLCSTNIQNVKTSQLFPSDSDSLRSKSVVYRNISASVRRQNDQKPEHNSSKTGTSVGQARSKTERHIIFETHDSPETRNSMVPSCQSSRVTHDSSSLISGNSEKIDKLEQLSDFQQHELSVADGSTSLADGTLNQVPGTLYESTLDIESSHNEGITIGQSTSDNSSEIKPEMLHTSDKTQKLQTSVDSNQSSVIMVYKNSDGSVIMVPKSMCSTAGNQSIFHAPNVLQTSTVETCQAQLSWEAEPQSLPSPRQSHQLQQHSADSGIYLDVTQTSSNSAEGVFQQHYLQTLPGEDTSSYSVQDNIVTVAATCYSNQTQPVTSTGTHITVSHRTSSANQGPSIITSINHPNSVKTSNLRLRGEEPLVEREKYIIKPKKTSGLPHTHTTVTSSVVSKSGGAQKDKGQQSASNVQSTDAQTTDVTDDDQDGKRAFTCKFDKCCYSTSLYKDFQRHYRRHTGERPYTCKDCGKTFNRSDKLKIHLRWHAGTKPFQCQLCNYAALEGGSLKKHMRIHTDERPFKCQICSYASRNSSQLIVHLRTHTGDSPFHCTKCSAKFKINSDLKRHMRVHTGEKPYQCEKCDYRSSNKGNLKTHVRINHSKENEIQCPKCEFVTSSKKMLREHTKIHDSKRVHKCTECEYSCTSNNALRSHATIHNTVKPYRCNFCSYSSKQSGNLKKHVQNLHLDKLRSLRHGKSSVASAGNSSNLTSTNRENVVLPVAERSNNGRRRLNASGYRKLHICEECGCSFVREDSLRCHMKHHSADARGSSSKEDRKGHSSQQVHREHHHNPIAGTSALPSYRRQGGIPHIFAAASKLYEQDYCSEGPVNSSAINSHSATSVEAGANSGWASSNSDCNSPAYSDSTPCLSSVKRSPSHSSQHHKPSSSPGHSRHSDRHSKKSLHNVPWEHRSYTLSVPSDDEASDPMLAPSRGHPSASGTKTQNGHILHGKSHRPHHRSSPGKDNSAHSFSENTPAQQSGSNSLKRRRMEKTFTTSSSASVKSYQVTQPQLQQQQQPQQQMSYPQQVFGQQPTAATLTTCAMELSGVSNTDSTLVLNSQGGDGSIVDPTYSIQLVPQVSTLPQGSPQITAITQELLRQLSAQAVPQIQLQPATHIQIVLPGATTVPGAAQVISGGHTIAPQQQIMLQIQGNAAQPEMITIPITQLASSSQASDQVPAQTVSHFSQRASLGQTGAQIICSNQMHSQSVGLVGTQFLSPGTTSNECVVTADVSGHLESQVLTSSESSIPVLSSNLAHEVIVNQVETFSATSTETRGPDL